MTAAWRRPAAAIRRCACVTDGAAMSAPVTWPEAPTRAASSNTVVPLPQPMSSTRSPGCGAAAVISASKSGTSTRSIRSC